jgi:hypothetical protein
MGEGLGPDWPAEAARSASGTAPLPFAFAVDTGRRTDPGGPVTHWRVGRGGAVLAPDPGCGADYHSRPPIG